MRLRDLIPEGETAEIGSFHFSAEVIIAFAEKYDPHFFHVDAEKAKQSLFGGLCASGWQVCAVAMKCNVEYMQSQAARLIAAGQEPPKIGPSPGVKNLRWIKPVFAGDTIRYSLTNLGSTPSPNRPGRQVCTALFEGVNQNGEPVMRFEGSVIEFD